MVSGRSPHCDTSSHSALQFSGTVIPLPSAFSPIGHEQDLERIKQRLRGVGNVTLTALNGLPGVGKAALSIILTYDPELRAYFSDGVLWAGLGPHPDLLGLLSRFVSRETQRAQELVQAVGGLPLALTLLGNYLRKQAYSGPTRRITAAMECLSNVEVRLQISEPHVLVESHPSLLIETSLSLQSVIAATDQLLPVPAQLALYALSVFPHKPIPSPKRPPSL